MLTLLHISDLHFGPPYLPHVGDALARLAPTLRPDMIVASGDFTQRATPEQFAEAREFLKRLPDVPVVTVPGNHDVPLYRVRERLGDALALYREYISPDLNRVWRVEGAVIVALDSTSPRRLITNGTISRKQIELCERTFAEAPSDVARIVVAHHHFAPAPDYVHDQTMVNAKRALKKLTSLRVDLILGGHLHRAYIGNSLDLGRFPEGGHQGIIIVQCGTTTSGRGRGRERERNSFNRVTIDSRLVTVTHYMYFEDTDRFEAVSRHTFPRRDHRVEHLD